jgi:hypothetical protein
MKQVPASFREAQSVLSISRVKSPGRTRGLQLEIAIHYPCQLSLSQKWQVSRFSVGSEEGCKYEHWKSILQHVSECIHQTMSSLDPRRGNCRKAAHGFAIRDCVQYFQLKVQVSDGKIVPVEHEL